MDQLLEVVTIAEAAKMFGRSASTIRYHVNCGNFQSRRVGGKNRGIIIISVESIKQFYNEEPERLSASYLQAS